jgi:hypothetical protein
VLPLAGLLPRRQRHAPAGVVLLRNDPKDSPWRPHWSFHAFEADMKARIGVDPAGELPSTVARQTAAIPYRSG